MARYNSDGSLDSSFGTGGKVTTDFMGRLNQALAYATLIQNDGKIVAAGRVDDVSSNFGMARYNSDGSLDLTFGSGGKVITDFAGLNDEGHGLVIQGDGKLVLAGTANDNNVFVDSAFALARYNSDGSLDNSFGSGGKVITEFGTVFVGANALLLQSDGKLVAAGGAGLDFALARYNSDGSLDASFGTGGMIRTPFNSSCGRAEALAVTLQRDGRIVAAGYASLCSASDFALARYIGITAPDFDICLQDDRNGNLLRFNSTTGDYQFFNCRKGLSLTGSGSVIIRFCKVELQDVEHDRNISVLANTCAHAGTASIQDFSRNQTFTITDRDITNNTCVCR
ncbi:MAG: hypothetical protein ACLGJB_27155 [Blastocatellia bacterium]